MDKDVRHVRSGIEDPVPTYPAFTIRHSRESGRAGLRVCIEHQCVLTKMAVEKQ